MTTPLRTPSTDTSRRVIQASLVCEKAPALAEGSVFHRSLSSIFTCHFIRLESGWLLAWQRCGECKYLFLYHQGVGGIIY
ncbi:MAG: hypothetical protein KH897_13440 [Bacteroides sp.]|uniref:hypothetical protein n=1 Tax=Bacteroides sp. TaxID=29523 RepID=UPI0025C04F31|nr:hypothetical protein [Bacteroides sp.]MBS6239328.1 hypothetical protein [Bacteroides sp.]